MDRYKKTGWAFAVGALAAILGGTMVGGAAHAQSAPPTRVRGTVEALDAGILRIKSREGETVSVRLAETANVSGVVAATLADVKPGAYVGIAATPAKGGELRAAEVLIFPEDARGAGEGHGPWDLLPESTMTNATVAESVDRVEGRSLTLKYGSGAKTIVVPPEAPIVTFGPATRADLMPGAKVFVPATRAPDGALQATRVLVGKGGIAPPM